MDHGFEPLSEKGLTYPLGDFVPGYGDLHQLAPGIGWTRLPVPGNLDHINIWLLADRDEQGEGVAIVDTGLAIDGAKDAWETLFANGLAGKRVTRVVVTHFHPDHIGLAGWLCERFDVRLWINRTEWLMARMLTADIRNQPPEEAIAQMRFAGWSNERLDRMREKGWGNFAKMVSPVPVSHCRLQDGKPVAIGTMQWDILTGGGHTPEHVSLYERDLNIVIAGDQILPRITSNVSINLSEPLADPLGEWLEGLARFRQELDSATLVLPAHGRPFTEAHVRLDQLIGGHHDRLDELEAALEKQEMRAVDTFGMLFSREIDDSVYGLATGEAMAHLRHLEHAGRIAADVRDGVGWFRATS